MTQLSTEELTERELDLLKIYCLLKKIGLNQLKLKILRDWMKLQPEFKSMKKWTLPEGTELKEEEKDENV